MMKKLFGNAKHKDSSSPSLNEPVEIAERSSNSLDYKSKNKEKMKKYKDYHKPQTSSAQSLPMNLPMGLPYASNLQHSDHVHQQQQQQQQHSKYTSEDESSSVTGSGSNVGANQPNYSANIAYHINSGESSTSPSKRTYQKTNTLNSTQNSIISQSQLPTTSSNAANLIDPTQFVKRDELDELSNQLKQKKEEHDKLSKELEKLKDQYQNELSNFHQSLTEERERHDRLEDQMNDLIELHQNEVENLKQIITDMEEKVQYQSEDRLRDINELLENCQTRISRMEHQQHQQFQQLVNLDSLENSHARQLILKLINILLTILQVILLVVATAASIIIPFLKTRFRVLTTLIFIALLFIIFNKREDLFLFLSRRVDSRYLPFFSFLHTQTNQLNNT